MLSIFYISLLLNFIYHKYYQLNGVAFSIKLVIRASVPKLNLDDTFEQKNEIAKAVEDELEKVDLLLIDCNVNTMELILNL